MSRLLLCIAMMVFWLAPANANEKAVEPTSNKLNKFSGIKVRPIESGNTIECHSLSLNDDKWSVISFDNLPQNSHYCIRAWVEVDRHALSDNPSLLIGMSGASSFYWDQKLISQNGIVGASKESEKPGTIKTIVRLPEKSLSSGLHLLSAEISTFHIGKKLDSIGYILSIVDEPDLNYSVLILSVLSATFIGVSLILCIIFQLLYWMYEKELAYQIFSVFCLSSAFILILEQAKFWVDYTYDWHVFRLSMIYAFTFLSSALLPIFYLFNYKLPLKKVYVAVIIIILTSLSLVKSSYDQTSTLIFSGALFCALFINLKNIKLNGKGKANVTILLLSMLFLYFIPEYFSEFGFSFVFVLLVMMMLVSLIKEMQQNKLKALKSERIKTELLRRNMQPHFLMNCLTQLMELIEVKPKSAVEFISVLSDEFRQLTSQNIRKEIPLEDEITLCNKHLMIMSFRYQQSYYLNVSGKIKGVSIPPSILHSQIENCFTHNQISSERSFHLIISQDKGRVNIVLKTPIDKRVDHKGTGTGEQYIRAKLAEVDQIKNHSNSSKMSKFESYEENQYWVSNYAFSE